MGILTKSKNGAYTIPAICSIIPGIGQFLKGHFVKGAIFLGVFLGWGIIRFVIGWIPIIGWLLPVIGILAWIINILDAAYSTRDIKTT